ncbi:hotdog fold domain-containing protein [Actinokineospora auranticolor]|uniref:Thioesterase superfamily protein n=1 Tax=Actinokineospora auranticolor TaxID=155976 RepID=A0A2S6GI77_9PSEU|nr:hotdog fold domain-containing protein [Actinokineospora auranticolor]PPK64915.1 thioesterase superfamily protein [Actinokineospora auranticolor]
MSVQVPWSVLPDYRCFGCSPHNPHGLRLAFHPRPDGLLARFTLDRGFESYPGVVHGGLVGVICDETIGNLIVLERHKPAFTVSMRTRFVTPLLVGREYRCVATLRADGEELFHGSAEVLDADGGVCATASAVYQPFALDQVRHQLTLDDAEVDLLSRAINPTAINPR